MKPSYMTEEQRKEFIKTRSKTNMHKYYHSNGGKQLKQIQYYTKRYNINKTELDPLTTHEDKMNYIKNHSNYTMYINPT